MLQCAWDLDELSKNVDKILVGSHVEVILLVQIKYKNMAIK